jgi:hypothetical protein
VISFSECVSLFRASSQRELRCYDYLHGLLCHCGVRTWVKGYSDRVYPRWMPTDCGLHLCQYPNQFARYLLALLDLGPIESYMELGVGPGGSFVATVEFLGKFWEVKRACGVDRRPPYPNVKEYGSMRRFSYIEADTDSDEVRAELRDTKWDLCFIDASHDLASVRRDHRLVSPHCKHVAFHDICSCLDPDVGRHWNEITAKDQEWLEFVEQYDQDKSWFGVGLKVGQEALPWSCQVKGNFVGVGGRNCRVCPREMKPWQEGGRPEPWMVGHCEYPQFANGWRCPEHTPR